MKKNIILLILIILVLMTLGLITCKVPPNDLIPKKAQIIMDTVTQIGESTVEPVGSSPVEGEFLDSSVMAPSESEPPVESDDPRRKTLISVRPSSSNIPTNSRSSNSILDLGEVVYKIPDTMRIFKTYQVTVRISPKQGTTEIVENLDGRISRATIPITSRMEVELRDASGDSSFTITKINADKQIVDSEGYTQWCFSVRPIKNGEKRLSLVVSVITGDDRKQKVYSDTIHVKDDVVKKVDHFWSKYWQWIFTTILIPFIIWIWNRKKKKD